MIELKTPRFLPVSVPEAVHEDPSSRFQRTDLVGIRRYYDVNGYVIVKDVIDTVICDELRSLWSTEVKPSRQSMYRQSTAKVERHIYNDNGWVMNPILNLQSLNPRHFGHFRNYATDNILANNQLSAVFRLLIDDRPKIVQSMYFEGNSATWEHQDSYYLDSERIGKMAAAWIAMEPIGASAGRFFVCPGSHRLQHDDHSFANNIADNHEVYIQSVVKKIRDNDLEIRAPCLGKGDVLFWNAWTIHGSLDSQDTQYSRSSITCHAIPSSDKFLQLQSRILDIATDEVNGVEIYRPKDLAKIESRIVFWIESNFPEAFYILKKMAVRKLTGG